MDIVFNSCNKRNMIGKNENENSLSSNKTILITMWNVMMKKMTNCLIDWLISVMRVCACVKRETQNELVWYCYRFRLFLFLVRFSSNFECGRKSKHFPEPLNLSMKCALVKNFTYMIPNSNNYLKSNNLLIFDIGLSVSRARNDVKVTSFFLIR